jgi:hypothetical protein
MLSQLTITVFIFLNLSCNIYFDYIFMAKLKNYEPEIVQSV